MQFTKPRSTDRFVYVVLILLVAGGLAILSACGTSRNPASTDQNTQSHFKTEQFALLNVTVEG